MYLHLASGGCMASRTTLACRDDSSMCSKCRKWGWHAKKCTWFILLEHRLLRVKVKGAQELGIDM